MVYDETLLLLLLLLLLVRATQYLFLIPLYRRAFPTRGISGRIVETSRPLLTDVSAVSE